MRCDFGSPSLSSNYLFFAFLISASRYSSIAIVIDGAVLVGALKLRLNPASVTALAVEVPRVPIATSP